MSRKKEKPSDENLMPGSRILRLTGNNNATENGKKTKRFPQTPQTVQNHLSQHVTVQQQSSHWVISQTKVVSLLSRVQLHQQLKRKSDSIVPEFGIIGDYPRRTSLLPNLGVTNVVSVRRDLRGLVEDVRLRKDCQMIIKKNLSKLC